MGKIIYLMGKSSSGKDTIYQRLLASGLKLERLVPYTTRPIRAGETEGVEYHFTDDAGLAAIRSAGKLVELREYHTCHGIWRYFTAVDDSMNLAEHNYILIGTIEAYRRMTEYFGQEGCDFGLVHLNALQLVHHLIELLGADLLRLGQHACLELLAYHLFDDAHLALFAHVDDGDAGAPLSCTSRSA